ncbi:hypothetical protein MHU86_2168 [Fragilaria crotonensis]|nr:hypothetical protein MHU86_2168 [Fragilaria crotonensis]
MFMAIPPDSDGHPYAFHAPSESAFFADMSAFDSEEDGLSEEGKTEQNEEPIDFRLLADQALKALEEDYTQTVLGVDLEQEKAHAIHDETGHESDDEQSGYELVEDQPIEEHIESKPSHLPLERHCRTMNQACHLLRSILQQSNAQWHQYAKRMSNCQNAIKRGNGPYHLRATNSFLLHLYLPFVPQRQRRDRQLPI